MRMLLTRRRVLAILAVYFFPALIIFVAAPFIGGERLSPGLVLTAIRGGVVSPDADIFLYQRLPRVALGFLVGGSLALVGSVLQVILRNPLATPYTLGITGGGAVGAVLAISVPALTFTFGPFSSVQVFSLLGCAAALTLIYTLARRPQGISMNTLLLAGVTVGILCGAAILLVRYLTDPYRLVVMDRWLMGGVDVVGYRELSALLPFVLPGLGLLLMQRSALNHLALGEEMASGHGVDVRAVQLQSFIGAGLTTAAAVSLTGPIGFVGLIVPHVVRRVSGFDHRLVLPASFLLGGAFLVFCDTIARTALYPSEMPVGIITALIGAPIFIHILVRRTM